MLDYSNYQLGAWPRIRGAVLRAAEVVMGSCFSDSSDNRETRTGSAAGEKTPLVGDGSSKPASPTQQRISKAWYHGSISKEEAELRLRSVTGGRRSKGTYLVYSDSDYEPGYILLVYKSGRQHRCKIRDIGDSRFVLEVEAEEAAMNPRAHSSVNKLISYHSGLFGNTIKLSRTDSVKLRDYATM